MECEQDLGDRPQEADAGNRLECCHNVVRQASHSVVLQLESQLSPLDGRVVRTPCVPESVVFGKGNNQTRLLLRVAMHGSSPDTSDSKEQQQERGIHTARTAALARRA